MNPDDPLEQLKALKQQQGGGSGASGGDPLEQLKALKTQTAASPAADGAGEGVLDHALEMATFGLHKKIVGAGQAIGDILQHGTNAHPIDTYNQSLQATEGREQAAAQQHPYANSAAGAAGFFGTLAADAPLRAVNAAREGVSLLPEAVDYAEGGPGVGAAIRRIGQSAKTGAGTGAVVAGLSGTGSIPQRGAQILGGGVLGGLLGGGAQTVGETVGGANSLLQHLNTPNSELGEVAANRRLAGKLTQDQLDPTDLLLNATRANVVASPTTVAHLGGPSLDNLTWLASTGASPEAAALKQGIRGAKDQEGALLERGLRGAAGVGDQSAYGATRTLENQQSQTANRLYTIARQQPPISDPEITRAIMNEPYLLESMRRTVQSLGNDATPEDLRAVQAMEYLQNNPNAPLQAISQPIPVALLDRMKQGTDDLVSALSKQGGRNETFTNMDASRVRGAMQNILQRVDQQVPAYGVARSVFKNDADRIAAIQGGGNLRTRSPEEITDELHGVKPLDETSAFRTNLAPQNQPDYRLGGVDALTSAMAEKGPTFNLTKGFFTSPADQGRVMSLLGPEGTQDFAPYRQQGETINRVYDAATGNSKTAERQGTQGEVTDNTAIDAAHLLTSPRRAIYNLPGKIKDAKDREVKQIMLQALARKLNIPADSPQLPGLVEQLTVAMQTPAGRDVNATMARRQSIARGAGTFSGLLSGGAFAGAQP